MNLAALLASFVVFAAAAPAASTTPATWKPSTFADESTLEFLTVGPEEGEHWSTVWFVILDGEVYLRLGTRAANRIAKHTTAPHFRVRVAGAEYGLRYEQAPEKAKAVAEATGEKYWSDNLAEPFRKLGLTGPVITLRILAE